MAYPLTRWRLTGMHVAAWLARQLGGRLVGWGLLVLSLVATGWLGYTRIWLPLEQEVSLPAGVTQRNPALQVDLLTTINNQRVQRTLYRAQVYNSGLERFFFQPTPSPAVSPAP